MNASNAAVKKEETPTSPSVEFGSVVFKRPADITNDTPSKRPRYKNQYLKKFLDSINFFCVSDY